MKPNYLKINQYLYYSYVFNCNNLSWVTKCITSSHTNLRYIPADAAQLFDQIINDLFSNTANDGYVIVPISGGWDSRILLGAALERFDTNQIKTLSFGCPGQLDYDIGKLLSEEFKLEHNAIDLSKVILDWESLLDSVKHSPWSRTLDTYFNNYCITSVADTNDVILSGFMGDPLTGGHLSNVKSRKESLDDFVTKQRYVKNSWLPDKNYNPLEALSGLFELSDDSNISFSEKLDLGVRQSNCIAPIVTPLKKWNKWSCNMGFHGSSGAIFLTPFADPRWASYWLQAPKETKINQKLYLEMMEYKFPKLSRMPSKYSWGAKPNNNFVTNTHKRIFKFRWKIDKLFPKLGLKSKKDLNYIDFEDAFRSRDDYQGILDQSISYLKSIDAVPWIDLEKMRNEHLNFKKNHEKAFLVIVGLALNLYNDMSE